MTEPSESSESESHFKHLIESLGAVPDGKGLDKTPARASKAFASMTSGYSQKLEDVVQGAVFEEKNNDMILLKDVPFYSLCEHHLVPFFGKCHVAYIPDGRVMGLSRISDVIQLYSRRLQVQERLTDQIADALEATLTPKGLGVVMEARHLCMELEERQSPSTTVTSCVRGSFRQRPETRAEFFSLIR
ncbi:GTP cyclohydrolase I FolE [Candidatus Micrarchaeota archaeon]|nr:GTP cyclohydrolase I FolE [Candidatus Micrarchaeota archaeon]